MNTTQASKTLGIHPSALYLYIKTGRLRATKLYPTERGNARGKWDFDETSVNEFLAERQRRRTPRPKPAPKMRRLTDAQKLGILVARTYYGASLVALGKKYGISDSGICHVIRRNAKYLRAYAIDDPAQPMPPAARLAPGCVVGNNEDGFAKIVLWTDAVYADALRQRAEELFRLRMDRSAAGQWDEPNYADCAMDAQIEFGAERHSQEGF